MSDRPDWTRHDVRRRRRRAGRQRLLALVALLAGMAVIVAVVVATRDEAPPPPVATVPPPTPVTFPEGWRREQMAKLLEEKTHLSAREYLAATGPGALGARLAKRTAPTSLEGFLFPATYEIGTETTVDFLVSKQVEAFEQNMANVNLAYATSKNLTAYDVLIIASMVEREVQVPAERPIVAGVMYNRLNRRMRLDIDATVQYAVSEDWRPLTAKDLESESPYNTRKFAGLPPGPIANPGLASLRAAARPRPSDYLYYVARDDGTGRHYFARNIDEFEALKVKAAANRSDG